MRFLTYFDSELMVSKKLVSAVAVVTRHCVHQPYGKYKANTLSRTQNLHSAVALVTCTTSPSFPVSSSFLGTMCNEII